MSDNWIWIAMLCSIGVSSVSLALGAWLPRNKGIADWLMGIGGVLFLIGVWGMSAFFLVPALSGSFLAGETTAIILYSSISGGLLLFSMGYIADRVSRARSTRDPFPGAP